MQEWYQGTEVIAYDNNLFPKYLTTLAYTKQNKCPNHFFYSNWNPDFDSGTKFRARERIISNLRFADALSEAEEIGFATENCFDETLNRALQELMQYQHNHEDETEVVEEELIYEFDDIVALESEVEIEYG